MKPDNGNQNMADRLAQLEAKLDELERLPAIANQLAEMRATVARENERNRIAGKRPVTK